ncbi:MAG: CsgG/HfaB family protein [Thermodesulfobacteriota bacterium]
MKRVHVWAVVCIIVLLLSGCATPGQESFHQAQEFLKQNRLEEAIARLEQAIAQEPDQSEYRKALTEAKALYEKRRLEALNRRAEPLIAEAAKAEADKEWVLAVKKLREVRAFHPAYPDLANRLSRAETQGLSLYRANAEKAIAAEDWGDVVLYLSRAQEIAPDQPALAAGLKEARGKHTPAYYLSRAEAYSRQNAWDRVLVFLQKATALDKGGTHDQPILSLNLAAAQFYMNRAAKDKRRLYPAYVAILMMTDAKNSPQVRVLIEQLIAQMYTQAEAYEAAGQIGNAYAWYDRVNRMQPEYKEVFTKLQDLKDRLRARVIKKIAVMDFTSPTSNAEAGRIVTDSLLSYLTTNATGDVKILARDVMGAILKEIEMGQAGLYDIESAKKAGKLKGTDIFIFGSVLQYNVEKQTSEGQKMANVVVATKKVPNPTYQMWLMSQKGSPAEADMKNAPPPTIEEEIRETVRYKVGTEKKRAFIRISYRLIDVEGGEVITTRNLQKVKEVSDDFSEGIPQANIPFDPLKIAADTELLDQVTQDIVTDLGKQVLGYFSSPQTLYMKTGDALAKKRDYEKAVEKYIDAITLEEMKNITGPLTTRAHREIDLMMNTLGR